MHEEFTGLGSRDFRQRYTGSYGWYTTPGGKRVMVLMDVINDHEASFQDRQGNKYRANADTGVSFEFIPITKKLFIHDKRLLLITRTPARMWARGINTQNTAIRDVVKQSGVGLSFERIVATMEEERYQEDGEIKLLSNLFAIGDNVVYIYDKEIGEWSAKTQTIKLHDKLFYQEIVDLVKKLGKPWKVENGNAS